MKSPTIRRRGFTLIELLAALLILSLLALMSYRGLGAVLQSRERLTQETEKWRFVSLFFSRFERDIQLAAPRPVRHPSGSAPAWRGQVASALEPQLELSRFAASDRGDSPRRVAYRLNENREIELWLWPGLDPAPGLPPQRHAVLAGVALFELRYLTAKTAWVDTWPTAAEDNVIPLAVRVRIALATGEEVVRVFAPGS